MRAALLLSGFLAALSSPASAWQNLPTAPPDSSATVKALTEGAPAEEEPSTPAPASLARRPTVRDDRFAVYVGLSASYDSGLAGAYIQEGQGIGISASGADLNWGITGRHSRKKDVFDLNYSGHFYDYVSQSKYNGQDHSLAMGYTRELTPRVLVGVRETASYYSNAYSVLNSTSLAETSSAGSTLGVAPNIESFDDRTYFTTTQVSLVWQKTARFSVSITAAQFLVRRNSPQLADSNGYQTSLDIAYRLTKRQTVGAYYTHSAYSFRKQFGGTDADSAGASYAVALTRKTDISFRGGVTKFETQGLGTVIPNPLVQSVLGISSGVEKQYVAAYVPDVTVTVSRQMKKSSMGATFTKGISPGNGLVLFSARESESIFYNVPTFREYATQFGAGRDVLNGYLNSPGQYSSYYARFSLSHPVMANVSSILNFDFRKYSFESKPFGQTEFRISVGLRYSPGDRPLKFW